MTANIKLNQDEIEALKNFSDKEILDELIARGYFGEIRKPFTVKIGRKKQLFLSSGIKAI